MQIFQSSFSLDRLKYRPPVHLLPGNPDRVCVFDIETTGLSPRIANVYLIGAAVLSSQTVEQIQWFSDDYTSEPSLLEAFSDYLKDFDCLVHYNGTTFDIPFLEKKYADHHLPSPFSGLDSLDLYRRITARKELFPTSNRKLVTMERFFGYDRGQDHSGRECIQLYSDFMQHKYAHRDQERDHTLRQILAHNEEDLIGTIECLNALYYTDYTPFSPTFTTDEEHLIYTDRLPDGLIFPHECEYDRPVLNNSSIRISYTHDTLTVTVPLVRKTLYHYFPDFADYYYLPDEDMAVHKSVGSYVDRAHRKQATASTCYIKKSGTFMPLPPSLAESCSAPLFFIKSKQKGPVFVEASEIHHSASAEMTSFLL